MPKAFAYIVRIEEPKREQNPAERLFLSQSCSSKQLTKLRALFDDSLFELRIQRAISHTQSTLALAPKIHQILLQIEKLTVPEVFDPPKKTVSVLSL
ncbi:hypothetical protein O9992_23885 [Vibrio lentus]|nr:hypothetical protein [Vibrio lentus]